MNNSRQLFAPLSPRNRYYETSYTTSLPATNIRLEGEHREHQLIDRNQSWFEPHSHSFSHLDQRGGHVEETVQITRKGRWSPEEDDRLISGIQKFGANRWKEVAEQVGSRTGDQCWKRWNDSLDPRLKHSQWTSSEDALLEEAVLRCGRMWSKIASDTLPGRSGLSCKNRWDHIQRKQRRIHQSERQLMQQEQQQQQQQQQQQLQQRQEFPLLGFDKPHFSSSLHRPFAPPRPMTHLGHFSTLNSVSYRPLSHSYDSRSTIYDDEEQESSGNILDYDSSEGEVTHEDYESKAEKKESEEVDELDQEEEFIVASHVDSHLLSHKEALNSRALQRPHTLFSSDDPFDYNRSLRARQNHRSSTYQQFDDAKPLFLRESLYPTLSSTSHLLPTPKSGRPQSLIEPRNYPASWYPTTSQYSILTAPNQLASARDAPQQQLLPHRSLSSTGLNVKRSDFFADAKGATARSKRFGHFDSQINTYPSSSNPFSSNHLPFIPKSNEKSIVVKREDDVDNYQWSSSIYSSKHHNDGQADRLDPPSSNCDNSSHLADWSTSLEEDDDSSEHHKNALAEPFYTHIYASS